MPEHDDHARHVDNGEYDTSCGQCHKEAATNAAFEALPGDSTETWDEFKKRTSTTPNLRIPKADRWGVEDKVVDGESK